MAILNNFTRIFKDGVNYVDATIDPGGIPLKTSENFSDAGDDSHPLPGDYAAAVEIQRSGGAIVVGYNDPKNAGVTLPGGKRIYARNEDGDVVCEVWLKNNGSITVKTENASIIITKAGVINIISAENVNIETPKQINLTANDTNIYGNFNVDIGISGVAGPSSNITFINGIATSIT